MEEDTGAVGAHRRDPTQEATPELMHERFPGKGGLSMKRRHLCTCLERETPSGAGQVIFSVAGTRGRQWDKGGYDTGCNLDFILMGMGSMEGF